MNDSSSCGYLRESEIDHGECTSAKRVEREEEEGIRWIHYSEELLFEQNFDHSAALLRKEFTTFLRVFC